MQILLLVLIGVATGAIVALQNVINASLGRYVGALGAVFVVAVVGALLMLVVVLVVPGLVSLRRLPGPSQWYLYLGGVVGILIVAAPVFLVPRIGATATVTAIVSGQLIMALAADQFGLLGTPQISISPVRVAGVILLAAGAFLVVRT